MPGFGWALQVHRQGYEDGSQGNGGVSSADFGALVEDLVKALDKFNVGATEKNEILGALGPMKGDIVEK